MRMRMKMEARSAGLNFAFLLILVVQLICFPTIVIATDPNAEGWPLSDMISPYAKKVPMADGKKLATIVYDPEPIFDINRRGPTILIRSPYNIAGDSSDLTVWSLQSKYPGAFFVTQDMRGRYNSEGTDDLFGTDYADGFMTIQWLKSNGYSDVWWYNGLIGSWGASALGINQYTYAGMNVPELRAQYISVASPMQYDHIFFQGGQFRYNMIMSWSTGQDSGNSAYNPILNPHPSSDYAKNVIAAHPVKDGWWEPRNLDINNRWANVHQAAVHTGGWDDSFSEGTLSGFLGYSNYGNPEIRDKQVLILAGMGHGYPVGDIPWQNYGAMDNPLGDWEKKLFDTELLLVNGARGSSSYNDWWASQQRVAYYVYSDPAYYGIDPLACTWRVGATFPVSPTTAQQWYLLLGPNQHSGILSLTPSSTTSEVSYYYDPSNPCPTNGGNNLYDKSFDSDVKIGQGSTDQRGGSNDLPNIVSRSDVITFTSPVLNNAYEFTGNVQLKLYVKSNRQDTDFVGKLIDVFPDGREMLITDGIIRAARRSGYHQTAWMDGSNSTIYELNVDLWSKAWRFQPGHKIKLLVTSSNYPRFLRNPNKAVEVIPTTLPGDYLIAQNTIVMSNEHRSHLTLPISDGYIYPPSNSNINIVSDPPGISNETSYTVKWVSENVDANGIRILLNGEQIATGLAANNSDTGYTVTNLLPNILNNITLFGTYSGNPYAANATILIRTYSSAPEITLIKPAVNGMFPSLKVTFNWSVNAINSGGLDAIWIETDEHPIQSISPSATSNSTTFSSAGEHWVNIISRGANGMYSNINRSFIIDLDPPWVTITSDPPDYSPSLSYQLTWTNYKCDNFTVLLNGTQIGVTYYNASQSALIENLVPNTDNVITVVGWTAFDFIVTDTIILHPYTGLPEIYNISPGNGSKIWRTETIVSWIPNATLAGGIGSITITTSASQQIIMENPTNSSVSVSGFSSGSQWIHFFIVGKNGLNLSMGVNFTVDLSDLLAPLVTINSPTNQQVFNVSNINVSCTITEQGGGHLEQYWTIVKNRTNHVIYNFSFFSTTFNITLPKEDTYFISVYARDAAHNIGNSNITIYFDIGPPVFANFMLPLENLVNQIFEIEYALIEGNLANITYTVGSTGTLQLLEGKTIDVKKSNPTIIDGVHLFTLTANDYVGYSTTQQAMIVLDMKAPKISIFEYQQDGIYIKNTSTLELEIIINEASMPQSAHYSLDTQENVEIAIQKTSTYGFFKINITEYGVHLLSVRVIDKVGNIGEQQFTLTLKAPEPKEPTEDSTVLVISVASIIAGSGIAGFFGFKYLKGRALKRSIQKEEVKKLFGWED